MHRGYICSWRKSFDSDVSKNVNVWYFWSWCLHKATYKEYIAVVGYQKIKLNPGQLVFGRRKAAKDLPLSEREIRTCVQFLVNSGNLTIKTTHNFSIITIVNWDIYQDRNNTNVPQIDPPTTHQRPTNDHIQEEQSLKQEKLYIVGKPDGASSQKPEKHIPYAEIIEYLNKKTGKRFTVNNKSTKDHIKARFNQGFTFDDFIVVIDKKCSKWLIDPKMSEYLRPLTLFGSKFESYLNENSQINGNNLDLEYWKSI